MEQCELSLTQLEKFLPNIRSITKEWGWTPEFMAKLINGYFKMRKLEKEVYSAVQSSISDLQSYYLEIAATVDREQSPIEQDEMRYLKFLPLKEGISPQEFKEKHKDYQMALFQEFFDCFQLSEQILNQFFSLDIGPGQFPALNKERERLRRKFADPNYEEPKWNTPKEREEASKQILQAADEFGKLLKDRRIHHLDWGLVNNAYDIYQIKQSIDVLKGQQIGKLFLLTHDDVQRLAHPIQDISARIHNFVCGALYACGGEKGVMYDLHQLTSSKQESL